MKIIILIIFLVSLKAQNITIFKNDQQYRGTWYSDNSTINFDFLTEENGRVDIQFQQIDSTMKITFYFYNPQYIDEHVVLAYMRLKNITNNDKIESLLQYNTYNRMKSIYNEMQSCNIQYKIQQQDTQNPPNNIYFSLQSSDCNIKMHGTLTLQQDNSYYGISSINFCLFSSLICFLQQYSLVKLVQYFTLNEMECNKLSLLTIGFSTIYDQYLSLAHLYISMHFPNQIQYFLIPSFSYFVLSSIFEMKLLSMVWKVRFYSNFQNPQQIRRGIALFQFQFYFALFAFLLLMYYFYLYNWFIITLFLFIIPQIVHNCIKGNNPNFYSHYIFGMIFPKIALPLYFRGCPKNIQNLAPSISVCIIIPTFFVFQALILYLQMKLGARFFVPSIFLPKKYNYIHEYEYNAMNPEQDDCTICLNNLYMENDEEIQQVDNSVNGDQNINNSLLIRKVNIMKTQCGHKFHIQCLSNWIQIKLECPTCRTVLPPL